MLLRAKGTLLVGVFKNQSPEFINQMVDSVGLDLVQLHGNEEWEMCDKITVPCVKVIHVKPGEKILLKPNFAIAILLDSPGGGTGVALDWKACKRELGGVPFMLAGGLSGDNVTNAIDESGCFAVDTSSGVQVNAREKDKTKIKAFIEAAKKLL